MRIATRSIISSLLLALGLSILGSATAQAVRARELEDQVRAIAAELRCPVCQNLSVADSPSALAGEMRGLIREQLKEGKTAEEIKAYFVSKYGEWILLSPKPRGLNLLVWVLPFAAAVAGIASVIFVARKWVRRPAPKGEVAAVPPAALQQIERELAAFEPGRPPAASEEGAIGPLRGLLAEKRKLYEALLDLDFDYGSGKLSEADYRSLRASYLGRAASLLERTRESEEGAAVMARKRPDARQAASQVPRTSSPSRRRPRPLQFILGAAFLVLFGVGLGALLTQSLRPRAEGDTITGDFLTGTDRAGGMAGMPGVGEGAPPAAPSGRRKMDPQMMRGMLDAAHSSLEAGRLSEAIAAYKAILDRDPDNAEAHTHMGVILARIGHVDGALKAFNRALAIDPTYAHALWDKGLVLFEQQKDDAGAIEAWEAFLKVAGQGPDTERVRRWIAEARAKLAEGKRQGR